MAVGEVTAEEEEEAVDMVTEVDEGVDERLDDKMREAEDLFRGMHLIDCLVEEQLATGLMIDDASTMMYGSAGTVMLVPLDEVAEEVLAEMEETLVVAEHRLVVVIACLEIVEEDMNTTMKSSCPWRVSVIKAEEDVEGAVGKEGLHQMPLTRGLDTTRAMLTTATMTKVLGMDMTTNTMQAAILIHLREVEEEENAAEGGNFQVEDVDVVEVEMDVVVFTVKKPRV